MPVGCRPVSTDFVGSRLAFVAVPMPLRTGTGVAAIARTALIVPRRRARVRERALADARDHPYRSRSRFPGDGRPISFRATHRRSPRRSPSIDADRRVDRRRRGQAAGATPASEPSASVLRTLNYRQACSFWLSFPMVSLRARIHQAGFDWHLTKPIDLDTLCTVLQDRPSAEIGPARIGRKHSDQG